MDAAVAAAWALAVCEPGNSGLGGQTTLLIRLASGDILLIDGHSRAPAAVSLDTVSHKQQRVGYRATTVPTTPIVLETARRCYGRLAGNAVLEPAIRLAQDGYRITRLQRRQVGWCHTSLSASPSASSLLLDRGRLYDEGTLFVQPLLAATLRRIGSYGADDFYHGQIARDIARDMQANGGLLTPEDLAQVNAPTPQSPLSTIYRNWTVVTAPPPGGGMQVLLGLKILSHLDLSARDDPFAWYRDMGEITYLVFREREQRAMNTVGALLGRGDSGPMEERAASLSEEIQHADKQVHLDPEKPRRTFLSDAEEPGETTHLCTADAEGNVVSLTQSIQSLFGARVVCRPCGFLYNNYLVTCPRGRHPNQLAGGCLPRSNAAPTILLRTASDPPKITHRPNENPTTEIALALGAAGSRRITSSILQTIGGFVERDMSLVEAVDAPRIHVKQSRNVWLEQSCQTEALLPMLSRRFRSVELGPRHSYAMGCVQAIQVNSDGQAVGVADPRREGTAIVMGSVSTARAVE